jgi:hypothetical protein
LDEAIATLLADGEIGDIRLPLCGMGMDDLGYDFSQQSCPLKLSIIHEFPNTSSYQYPSASLWLG